MHGASDEIDLLLFARSVWRHRIALVAIAAIAAAAAYAVSRSMRPAYEVAFRLIASEPPLDERVAPDAQGRTVRRDGMARRMAAFRGLARSAAVAEAIVAEFGLSAAPHHLSPQRYLARHVSVAPVPGSTIFLVTVRLGDADLLMRVASRHAERTIEAAHRLNADEWKYTSEPIQRERDTAEKRLRDAEQALRGGGNAADETLKRDYELARHAYIKSAALYDEARLHNIARSSQLRLLDPPLRPDAPVSPRPARTAAAAALLALTAGVVAVIVFDQRRSRGQGGQEGV